MAALQGEDFWDSTSVRGPASRWGGGSVFAGGNGNGSNWEGGSSFGGTGDRGALSFGARRERGESFVQQDHSGEGFRGDESVDSWYDGHGGVGHPSGQGYGGSSRGFDGGGGNWGGGMGQGGGGVGGPRNYDSCAGDGSFRYPEHQPLQMPKHLVIEKEPDAKMLALTNNTEKWSKNRKFSFGTLHGKLLDSDMIRKINRTVFKNQNFRTHQEEVINAALSGEDVFVLMPTGGGKSLCYQLCAVTQAPGITVVISPLVSLMQDQVYNLRLHDVPAINLNASSTPEEVNQVYECFRCTAGHPPAILIYITPEKFSRSGRIRTEMRQCRQNGRLSRVVVDEAHCVSEWGHDFRPDYKLLASLKQELDNVPIMALTATATQRVRKDIRAILNIPNSYIFCQSFNRPNLLYEVRSKKKAYQEEIISFIKEKYRGETGIIYCISKLRCEDMAESLNKEGIRAKPYHAGLDEEIRRRNQDDWSNDKVHVICATIAFGMGINKPDVRFVVHDSLPKSMEGYYQESGRAGRDGKQSHCILFYQYRDKLLHDKMSEEDFKDKQHRLRGIELQEAESQRNNLRDNLNAMVAYCESNSECRRCIQMRYFGEDFSPARCNKTCDNCWGGQTGTAEELDVTKEAEAYVSIVEYFEESRTSKSISFMIKVFRGSQAQDVKGYQHVKGYGVGKAMKESDATCLYRLLAQKGILKETSEHNTASMYGGTMTKLEVGPKRGLLRTEGLKMSFKLLPEKPERPAKGKKGKEAKESDQEKSTDKLSTIRERKSATKKKNSLLLRQNIESDSDVCDLTVEEEKAAPFESPGKVVLIANNYISAELQESLNGLLHKLRDQTFEELKKTNK